MAENGQQRPMSTDEALKAVIDKVRNLLDRPGESLDTYESQLGPALLYFPFDGRIILETLISILPDDFEPDVRRSRGIAITIVGNLIRRLPSEWILFDPDHSEMLKRFRVFDPILIRGAKEVAQDALIRSRTDEMDHLLSPETAVHVIHGTEPTDARKMTVGKLAMIMHYCSEEGIKQMILQNQDNQPLWDELNEFLAGPNGDKDLRANLSDTVSTHLGINSAPCRILGGTTRPLKPS